MRIKGWLKLKNRKGYYINKINGDVLWIHLLHTPSGYKWNVFVRQKDHTFMTQKKALTYAMNHMKKYPRG